MMTHSHEEHGGNLYAAARRTGRRPEHLVDFSANINPLSLPRRLRRTLCAATAQVSCYPDPEAVDLIQALASRWTIPRQSILPGNGSTELIHLIPRAMQVRHALIIGPTFSEYARAVTLAGGDVTWVLAREDQAFEPLIGDILPHLETNSDHPSHKGIDAVFLCNPNSPTGRALAPQDLMQLMETCARYRIWLVIDEAFVEFSEQRSIMASIATYPQLLILRSFTKFFGLPGLRMGCLVGSPEAVGRVRSFQPPWSVNCLAQVAARAILCEHHFLNKTTRVVLKARGQLMRGLERIPGVRVFPSVANFLLVKIEGGSTAADIQQQLEAEGMLVKSCAGYPGMHARLIRVGVRLPAGNRRLIKSLARILGTP